VFPSPFISQALFTVTPMSLAVLAGSFRLVPFQ
jgi:hypothetical protein